MTEYRVSWTVDIDAGDPIEAAIAAFNMMQQRRDPNDPDAAVVFEVWQSFDGDPMDAVTVDLATLEFPILGNPKIGYELSAPGFWNLYDLATGDLIGPATGEQVRASIATVGGGILIDVDGKVIDPSEERDAQRWAGPTRKVYVA